MTDSDRKLKTLSVIWPVVLLVSVLVAGLIAFNYHWQRAALIEEIHVHADTKLEEVKIQIEKYFYYLHALPRIISQHDDVIAMNTDSERFIQAIYDDHYDDFLISEIYVVKRDFDGTHAPFMTFEHGENGQSVEKTHNLESEAEEYKMLMEVIRQFDADPSLEVLISSSTQLCTDENGLIYAVPVRSEKDELVGIVTAMMEIGNIREALEKVNSNFNTALYSDEGDLIFCDTSDQSFQDFLEDEINKKNTAEFSEDHKHLQYDDETLRFVKTEIEDDATWYLVIGHDEHAELVATGFPTIAMGYLVPVIVVLMGILGSLLCKSVGKQIIEIEERKKSEEKLEHANTKLQDSMEKASVMANEAIKANNSKSEFLANMSHEIRTPMNAILGFSEILAEEELTADQKNYVGTIRNSGNCLLGVIDDILDFSKIEAGKLETETVVFSFGELLESMRALFSLTASEKGLSFEIICEGELVDEITTDPARLKQCLTNLISNAIKFTESGYVRMRVSGQQDDGLAQIRFDIEDSGIGISDDVQKKIFNSFTQADGSTTRKYGGTGLGLTITKQLVTLLNGELFVVSEEGKGSVFTIIIPVDVNKESELVS